MRVVGLVCLASMAITTSAVGQRQRTDPTEWRVAQKWKTDWSTYTLHPDSLTITSGRDNKAALDYPKFETIESANRWLKDREPVSVVSINGDVRAYPIQIMFHHDIANDVVGGQPIVVTYCPLCGSALAFDRRLDGHTLEFSYVGALHNSNLLMYDRLSETFWAQAIGEGLVGRYAGQRLKFVSAPVMSFKEFKENEPNGRVLSQDTGYDEPYGRNRMTDYDTSGPISRLFRWDVDQRLAAKERVITIEHGDEIVAVPYTALSERKVVTADVGGEEYVILWGPGTASVYAERMADGIDVGAAVAYSPVVDGRRLRFRATDVDGRFQDRETRTTWTLAGKAIDGPLAGRTLTPAVHGVHFWFVWAAYRPETRVVRR